MTALDMQRNKNHYFNSWKIQIDIDNFFIWLLFSLEEEI